MSDLDESGVTYTKVSSLFQGLSDIGSPRADDHEYLELPGMLEDPYVGNEDPVDYPTDGGDDEDDEDKTSEEDEDDDVDIEADEDEEEEEEHPAPADSIVVALPATD
ncbi:hypothetical protein Tco_0450322 [Tanacetum coccineum]